MKMKSCLEVIGQYQSILDVDFIQMREIKQLFPLNSYLYLYLKVEK